MARKAQSEQALDERKDQIKRAALKVFAEKGLAGTKMIAIAEEAGISQGLTYKYFDSKDEIFSLLVEEAIEESQDAIRNIGQLAGSPLDQLRVFTLRLLDENHKLYFLLIQQAQKSEGVPQRAKEAIERYSPRETVESMIPILVRGQQEGQFAEGDPYRRLILFLSVVTGLMLQDAKAIGIDWTQEVDRLLGILTT
ncbi:TetR/AcrR family transcriptional regulator [Paenibacillus sacheonensis]|uniref:TetR family transcriptional regulator n=1 Tax=Paenibacillus sacheonensis TaxID=742054 RepID=A0A7X4YSY1_9BACL|nr:TetR/AcrR family transcriptional regulator [Paenibacillus sacheonensis]MBM7569504.1 AcrR family transcriptional regulator [Paenibacillus sacheonensis]NBC71905.1 TetR family transcriptional regulator [Paenibacillus sacheonensis]